VVIIGGLSAAVAVILAHTTGSALQMWFAVSAIVSGGLAGLFLLAFLSRRAHRRGVYTGIAASVVVTVWAVLTKGGKFLDLGQFNYTWDDLMIGALGHVVLLVTGYVASLLLPRRTGEAAADDMTLWGWLARNRAGAARAAVLPH
jgi:SSS family solute:Na+ symporter